MFLLYSELWFSHAVVGLTAVVFACIPSLFLALYHLHVNQLDEEHGQGVMLQMSEQTIKDFTVLLDKQIGEQ